MPMSDLQKDLRQLADGLTQMFARFMGAAQNRSAMSTVLAPPVPPERTALPPADLEMDLPLELYSEREPVKTVVKRDRSRHGLLDALREPGSVRDAFVLKEILDKPRANRPFRAR
jgi:hypothetical protein